MAAHNPNHTQAQGAPQQAPPGQTAVDVHVLYQQCAQERMVNLQLAQKNELIMKLVEQVDRLNQQLRQYQELHSAISTDHIVQVPSRTGEIPVPPSVDQAVDAVVADLAGGDNASTT